MASLPCDCRGTVPTAGRSPDWRAALADAITDVGQVCRLLKLPPSVAREAEAAAARFRPLVPHSYAARIQPGDPQDPLLLQVLPHKQELAATPGFTSDPVGEASAGWGPGLVRKYQGRVLMVATRACGVHCRYCFRRHFTHQDPWTAPDRWGPALEKVAQDPSLHEVILSGGDPLTLPDPVLGRLARQLAQIPHLQRLRIHTRLPVVIPKRVTPGLLAWLRGTRLATIVVIHSNHPAEIDADVACGLEQMVDAGVPVFNQSVLLRGVNDRVEVMAALCERLADLRVQPYYLHQLDRVTGAAHFEVPEAEGIALVGQLRVRLPGYAVPRYVRETPGKASKEVLA